MRWGSNHREMKLRSCYRHAVLALILLDVFILLYYVVHSPQHDNTATTTITTTTAETENADSVIAKHTHLDKKHENGKQQGQGRGQNGNGLKTWPILPSFVPWLPISKPRPLSCEAYFGNGFTRRIVSPETESKSSRSRSRDEGVHCMHSETLGTAICEFRGLVMNPHNISMSTGGEDVRDVLGRQEHQEMPIYSPGAFLMERPNDDDDDDDDDDDEGDGDSYSFVNSEFVEMLFTGASHDQHCMKSLLRSLKFVPSAHSICSQWIEEPTLLITRFEYANLFHTFTDWYSAYVTSRVVGLPKRPQIVFLDGHCKSPMEETWDALFSGFRYAKHFTGAVCFRHAILAPVGYETVLFKGLSETISCYGCSVHELKFKSKDHTTRLLEFGEMVRAAFGLLTLDQHISGKGLHGNILFIRRENYLAHPRHGGKVESRLSNEEEVFQSLQIFAGNYTGCNVTLVNGLFAHMSMKEQLQAVQAASIIVGAHGAGLTHIISARPGTVVLEIISSYYRRPHFALISQWRGLKYHPIYLQGSTAECSEVVEALRNILESLGC